VSQTVEESGEGSQAETPQGVAAEALPDATPEAAALPEAEPFSAPQASPAPAPRMEPTRQERREQIRKTRVVVRRVGPISVVKLSLIFYFCLMLIVFGGLLILYGIMLATGAIDKTAEVIGNLGFAPASGTFEINGSWLFTRIFVIGCGMVVVAAIINLFVAFLYNLLADVLGGLEVTLAEKRTR
jgi:transmembrane protein DUF3566